MPFIEPEEGGLAVNEVPAERLAFVPNERIYNSDDPFPAQIALIGDEAWVRNQQLARLELNPFQYLPASGKIIWHSYIKVKVQFVRIGDRGGRIGENTEKPIEASNDAFFGNPLVNKLLNADVAPLLQSYDVADSSIRQEAAPLAPTGPWVKIAVDHDGLYRLTYADLQQAGLDVGGIDPRYLHLNSQGREVRIYITGEADGRLDPSDTILFYGEKFKGDYLSPQYADEDKYWFTFMQQMTDGLFSAWQPRMQPAILERYTDLNVYWLVLDPASAGLRMQTQDGNPSGSTAPVASSYNTTVRAEKSTYWNTVSFTGIDPFFWDQITDKNIRHTYTTTLTAVSPGSFSATIRGEVYALNNSNIVSPDRQTVIYLNNRVAPIDTANWDGRSRYHFEDQVPQSDLVEGVNRLQFMVANVGIPAVLNFDWFEIDYFRRYLALQDQIWFSPSETMTVKLPPGGFTTANIQAFKITDATAPVRVLNPAISGTAGNYTAQFLDTPGLLSRYFVVGNNAIQSPVSISAYTPHLKAAGNGADYLLITHPAFASAAQALADYRSAQGMRTQVVDINDVYNEFSYGITLPYAIKDFLRWTFTNWQSPAPAYVVLVGDGHFNPKGYSPERYGTTPSYMLPNLAWVDPTQGEVDATNLLANIVGDDPLPDIYIGRITVNFPDELNRIITKIIAYENSGIEGWQRNLLFVTDNIPDAAGDFESYSNGVIRDYVRAGYAANRVYMTELCGPPGSSSCPAANTAIISSFNNSGNLLVNYNGHGAIQRWASEQVFRNGDVPLLSNGDKLPFILSMTCLDGFWNGALGPLSNREPSLIEELLRANNKGAVGAFSPTGLGVSPGHDVLQRGFYDSVFNQGNWGVSAAALAAKVNIYASGGNYDLLHTYMVFGDPALKLLSPYRLDLTPAESRQSDLTGGVVTYTLNILNASPITDTYDLSAKGNQWATTFPAVVGPVRGGESAPALVRVEIPEGIPGGTTDLITITATSRGDRSRKDTARLITTGDVFGLVVRPGLAEATSLAGSTVTYTLDITNTSSTADTYDLSLGSSAWDTELDSIIVGPLPAGGGHSHAMVTVQIPIDAPDKSTDTAQVTVVSRGDPDRSAISTFTTTARAYGVQAIALTGAQSGEPGTALTYPVRIKNTGGYADSFSLSTSGNTWPVELSSTSVGPLQPEQSMVITATVTIPAGASAGDTDQATVQAVSAGDPTKTAQVVLGSTATIYGVSVEPASDARSAAPGGKATYALAVTNLSNASDSFSVQTSGGQWREDAPEMTGAIGPGESTTISVTVSVPVGAASGDTDSVTVTLVSQGDSSKTDSAVLTTSASAQSLAIEPAQAEHSGRAGETVKYALTVTNSGNDLGELAVSIAGNEWKTIAPATLGPLGRGSSLTFEVAVELPFGVTIAPADRVTVSVMPAGKPDQAATATLTTTMLDPYRLFMPVNKKE